MMQLADALAQAEAHLKNATELAARPVGKEELLYMWDNQITALDNYLADSEGVQDEKLAGLRSGLRDTKRKLTDAVVAFEAAAAGETVEAGEPSAAEWVEAYLEQASEMVALVKECLAQKVKSVQDLAQWEEPLSVVNGFLADSEPFQTQSHDLRKARSMVRLARKELKTAIQDVFTKWKAADRAAGADGDEDDE